MSEPVFDPFDPEHYRDPFPRLAEARRSCPVSEPADGFVFVSRHADVRAWLRDHEHLSNAGNFRLDDDPGDFLPTMVLLDPPDHTRLRRLVVGAFSAGVVAAAEPFIRERAHALIDGFAAAGEVDLVAAFARPLPAAVIAHMVGVPGDDVDTFMAWTQEVTARIPVAGDSPALRALNAYSQTLVDRRRAPDAPDDLVTRLVRAEVDGERLSDREIVGTITQLILAGQDTVTRLLGNCLHQLLRDRRHWERLLAHRSLVPAAIEESLRFDAPIQWAMRTCKRPVEIDGVAVRPGTRVLLGIGSANRDERLWPDPEAFSLDRRHPATQLAFGYGVHLCLGAALGRAEGRIALDALLDRLPGLRLAPGFEYEVTETPMVRGPRRLDAVWPA